MGWVDLMREAAASNTTRFIDALSWYMMGNVVLSWFYQIIFACSTLIRKHATDRSIHSGLAFVIQQGRRKLSKHNRTGCRLCEFADVLSRNCDVSTLLITAL